MLLLVKHNLDYLKCLLSQIPLLSVNILTKTGKEGMFQTIISTISSFMYSKLLVIILIGAGCVLQFEQDLHR